MTQTPVYTQLSFNVLAGSSAHKMDKQTRDPEAAWEDIDEKVLLAQILTELQQIRVAIQGAEQGAEPSAVYECRKCGATVPEDARERHARETHRCPPGAEASLFTTQDNAED